MTGKTKIERIAIINRGFWPQNRVIRVALLQLAECLSVRQPVTVITQAEGDLRAELAEAHRGSELDVWACRARSSSNSSILRRILDSCVFMLWTFWSLIKTRPNVVYVSTNPPVLVPFIACVYAKLFGARYLYHLQDIHPEAANIIFPVNRLVYRLLKWMDCVVMRNADVLVTLSDDMAHCIKQRSGTFAPIHLLDNPAIEPGCSSPPSQSGDIVFCGNAGRLQRMELVVNAVRKFLQSGGTLRFTFIGPGVNKHLLEALSTEFTNVEYLGFKPAEEASAIVSQHDWALLPINDEVTRYAFPSKSSSYVLSGCKILAVCGIKTSVANWVEANQAGLVCEPNEENLIATFQVIEEKQFSDSLNVSEELTSRLSISSFVDQLTQLISCSDPASVDTYKRYTKE